MIINGGRQDNLGREEAKVDLFIIFFFVSFILSYHTLSHSQLICSLAPSFDSSSPDGHNLSTVRIRVLFMENNTAVARDGQFVAGFESENK